MLRLTAFPVRYPFPWQPTRFPPRRADDRGSTKICIAPPYAGHNAVDILGDYGLIVASSTDGTVAHSFFDLEGRRHRGVVAESEGDGGGNIVVIVDAAGHMHYYAHLTKFCVIPGQRVFAGQEIGLLGRTGRRAGPHPHLHYQVSAPLTDTSPDATNGFSTRDVGRRRMEAEQRSELMRLAALLRTTTDRFGRTVIEPRLESPPVPRSRWVSPAEEKAALLRSLAS